MLCLKQVVEEHFSEAEVVRIVQDNLNTHNPAAFYEVLELTEAKRLLDRLEFHYTHLHASWLNMAEIELSVLSRQCLNQRIATFQKLQKEVSVWVRHRNKHYRTVDWQFTTTEARIRLKRLYPSYLE